MRDHLSCESYMLFQTSITNFSNRVLGIRFSAYFTPPLQQLVSPRVFTDKDLPPPSRQQQEVLLSEWVRDAHAQAEHRTVTGVVLITVCCSTRDMLLTSNSRGIQMRKDTSSLLPSSASLMWILEDPHKRRITFFWRFCIVKFNLFMSLFGTRHNLGTLVNQWFPTLGTWTP